jgi:hypothetical protein
VLNEMLLHGATLTPASSSGWQTMRFSVLLCFFAFVSLASAQAAGPERGWLILQGGGRTTDEMKRRFVELAGGPDANFVVIPTAASDGQLVKVGFFAQGFGRLDYGRRAMETC